MIGKTDSSGIREILMLHHSHLDVGYTHSQPILWELQKEYIDEAIDWLERTADLAEDVRPRWTCEATEPVRRWLLDASEIDRGRFRALVAEGRIGLAALRWHVGAAIDRAGLERLVAGKRELEDLTGTRIRVACQHDVNGVPWAMADVLLDAGVDLFVMAVNLGLGNALQPRPGMFLWEAPSGRAIRVFNGHHYTMFDQLMLSWHDSVDKMAEGWLGLRARLADIDYGLDFVYLTSTAAPVMWDNAPPNPFMPDLLQRWNDAGRGPTVRYATFDDLRERVMEVPADALPRWRGDWTDYWSFGYGSTPIATALNQRAKPLATAAELLTAGDLHPTLSRATEKIDLFDEHTWGYYITDPGHQQAQTGDHLKQAYAHEAHELASFAVMDGLERLAGNPVADKGIKGVLLCNPTPHSVTIRPNIPVAWLATDTPETERTSRASRMFHHNRSWGGEFPGADARAYGPVELGPHSWRAIPFDELPPAAAPSVAHTTEATRLTLRQMNSDAAFDKMRAVGRIESPFHSLSYDAANGKILSLVDRPQNRELVTPRPGMDFFSFVRERPDALDEGSRLAFFDGDLDLLKYDVSGWRDWAPVREHATRVIEHSVRESHDRVTLERRFSAPGMSHLVQWISLLADDPVIHVDVELELESNQEPQGIYLAVPLALDAQWEAAFDTAGDAVRLDEEQLPGACRGWVTAESMTSMWDDETAVAMFVPDAPGVQFGDFHFGPPLGSVPRPADPLLLAWPVNNYWGTNFPQVQPGRIRLRYGFVSVPTADRAELSRHASAFRQPPLVWPITTGGRDAGSGPLPGKHVSGQTSVRRSEAVPDERSR